MSTAETPAVETTTQAAAPESTELEKKLAEKDAEIARLSLDKENYRKGMLKAKGKLKDDGTPEEEDIEEKIARLVDERLLDTQFSKATAEKDQLIKDALARNKELELAIGNRSQIVTTDSGSSSDSKFAIKDNTLSDAKLAALKAKGWDDKKIAAYKANLLKLR